MEATWEHEPDSGVAWRRHADTVARGEPDRASKARCGESGAEPHATRGNASGRERCDGSVC